MSSHSFQEAERPVRLLRLPDVKAFTGLSKSEIYRRIHNETFPAGKRISYKVVVWPEPLLLQWQRENLADEAQVMPG